MEDELQPEVVEGEIEDLWDGLTSAEEE